MIMKLIRHQIETLKKKVMSDYVSVDERMDNINSLMKKIMELKHKQAIDLDNISKQIKIMKENPLSQSIDIDNMSKQLEIKKQQLEIMEENRIDNESVNENDSKDDELAVAQFGPGIE